MRHKRDSHFMSNSHERYKNAYMSLFLFNMIEGEKDTMYISHFKCHIKFSAIFMECDNVFFFFSSVRSFYCLKFQQINEQLWDAVNDNQDDNRIALWPNNQKVYELCALNCWQMRERERENGANEKLWRSNKIIEINVEMRWKYA